MSARAAPSSPVPEAAWLIRLGDGALVLGHRLSEWCARAPTLEEDIAMANLALDLVGQARAFYQRACVIEGAGRTEDELAYFRSEDAFRNPLLVEQTNGNFADTIVRQLLFSAFAHPFYEALARSSDDEVAGMAARATKEMAYHLRHSGEWLIRLGDGTAESRVKAEAALDELWPFVDELFDCDALDRAMAENGFGANPSLTRPRFDAVISEVLARATLTVPAPRPAQRGGRAGMHGEHLGRMLGEMQSLARAHPGAAW